jgi:hypothetical protein
VRPGIRGDVDAVLTTREVRARHAPPCVRAPLLIILLGLADLVCSSRG